MALSGSGSQEFWTAVRDLDNARADVNMEVEASASDVPPLFAPEVRDHPTTLVESIIGNVVQLEAVNSYHQEHPSLEQFHVCTAMLEKLPSMSDIKPEPQSLDSQGYHHFLELRELVSESVSRF